MTTAFGQILTTTQMNVASDGVTAEFVNSLNTNDNVQITRTFAGAGRGLFVDMGPGGQAVTGNGIEVRMGAASTGHALRAILLAGALGDGLHVEDAGDGPAIFANKTSATGSLIDLQLSGNPLFNILADGSVTLRSDGGDLVIEGSAAAFTVNGDGSSLSAGDGGASDGVSPGGIGGLGLLRAGIGGAGSGAVAGGAGGDTLIEGGAGGAAGTGAAGAGGAVTIDGGAAGAGGTGGVGGNVLISAGAGTGANADGGITIGGVNTSTVNIGGAGAGNAPSTTVYGAETTSGISYGRPLFFRTDVGTVDPMGLFIATGTPHTVISAQAGSICLVDTGAVYVNTSAGVGTTWTMLAAGGGGSLQDAYDNGSTISVIAADGPVAISNSTDATNTLSVSRTFAGAGDGIEVSMSAATTGRGIRVIRAGSGTGVLVTDGAVDQTGINPGLIFQSSGNDLDVTLLSGGGTAGNFTVTVGTDTTAGGDGGDLTLLSGVGTTGSANNGGIGGLITLEAGAGGDDDSVTTDDAGAGGAVVITSGVGGAATGPIGSAGGAGGNITIAAASGGASAAFTPGAGGSITITAGDAPDGGSFNAAGGSVDIRGGTALGPGAGGDVNIHPGGSGDSSDGNVNILTDDTGLSVAANLNIGNTTNYPEVNVEGFLDLDFNLSGSITADIRAGAATTQDVLVVAQTTGATGDYLIRGTQEGTAGSASGQVVMALRQQLRTETGVDYGVFIEFATLNPGFVQRPSFLVGDDDPNGAVTAGNVGSLFLDSANAALYIKTAGPSTWAAVGGGGGVTDLQSAYVGGNTIAVTTAEGAITLSNAADVTDVMQITRTFAGGGDALQISMSPGGEAQSGFGINMSVGTGHTSVGVGVNSTATANIACFNAVQGASSAGAAFRAFMTTGATGAAFTATDGTDTLRLNLDSLRISRSFTIAPDAAVGTGGAAGDTLLLLGSNGAANVAGAGGAGGAINATGGTGGNGSGANQGGAGSLVSFAAGVGGQSVTGQAGTGGIATLLGGTGGAAVVGGTFGGFGGNATIRSGHGGAGAGTVIGGAAGIMAVTGGTGGASSGVTGSAGAGGEIQITAGAAGADNGGTGAVGGDVIINAGAGTGAAADGAIRIAPTTGTVGFFGATPVGQSAAYTPTNVTTDRAFDANSTTIDEIADVLGTLIADLQATGLLG